MKYLPFALFNAFLTFFVLRSSETTRKKIFVLLALWVIPFWGPVVVLLSITNLPASVRFVVSIALNAMLGFAFVVFAGAGAGNSNQGQYFVNHVLPVELGLSIALFVISVALLISGKTKWAVGLPFATLPLLVAGMLIAPMPQY